MLVVRRLENHSNAVRYKYAVSAHVSCLLALFLVYTTARNIIQGNVNGQPRCTECEDKGNVFSQMEEGKSRT